MNKICELNQQLADYYQNFSLFLALLILVLIGYILYDIYENY